MGVEDLNLDLDQLVIFILIVDGKDTSDFPSAPALGILKPSGDGLVFSGAIRLILAPVYELKVKVVLRGSVVGPKCLGSPHARLAEKVALEAVNDAVSDELLGADVVRDASNYSLTIRPVLLNMGIHW